MLAMGFAVLFVFCSLIETYAGNEVILYPDKPFLRVKISDKTSLECCFGNMPSHAFYLWVKRDARGGIQNITGVRHCKAKEKECDTFTFTSIELGDSGMYQCWLNYTVFTPGTYMHVTKPMNKLIPLSESTKNMILTVEGILLLLCIVVPSAMLMIKTKNLQKLERKQMQREEENIYQGLNLDDCCSTYDEIERSPAHGPYQDVGSRMGEGEIQLEKP